MPTSPSTTKKRRRVDGIQGSLGRSNDDDDDDDGDLDDPGQLAEEARAKAAAKESIARLQASRARSQLQEGKGIMSAQIDEEKMESVRRERNGGEGPSSSPAQSPPARPSSSQRTPPSQPIPSRSSHPGIYQCSPVSDYTRLNQIEEGSYGIVFRARHNPTGDIVALKKLKMDRERNGFPITSLREIRTLMMARHENVVHVREIAVGDTLTQIFIVFEFVEHDIKSLLTHLESPFRLSEIKTLSQQLLRAVALLHSQWIIHRDLKTSNLLLNNRGCLKLADFGLARLYGDPPMEGGGMTELVVTLWYRAPELLLGAKTYDVSIDMWSVGCIIAELLTGEPLFTGKNESDQTVKIFRILGQPSTSTWPGLASLPLASKLPSHIGKPYSTLRSHLSSHLPSLSSSHFLTDELLDLLHRLLAYDPTSRLTAEEALRHPWFTQSPLPAHPDSFGSYPSLAAGERRRTFAHDDDDDEEVEDGGKVQQMARAGAGLEPRGDRGRGLDNGSVRETKGRGYTLDFGF